MKAKALEGLPPVPISLGRAGRGEQHMDAIPKSANSRK
jgi:hypothetical protein